MTVKLTELPSFTDAALGVIVYDGKPRFVICVAGLDVVTIPPVVDPVETLTINPSVISFSSIALAATLVIVPIP